MSFKFWLRSLERRKIISRKPNPICPFILSFLILLVYFWSESLGAGVLSVLSLCLFIFSLVFAILHWLVVLILEN